MHNANIFEFKIPLGKVMKKNFGTKLNSIKFAYQDISNNIQ